VGIAGTFQTVQDEDDGAVLAGGPVQIQKIAIGQFQPLPTQRQARAPPEQHRPQRLGVWAGQPPGRAKRGSRAHTDVGRAPGRSHPHGQRLKDILGHALQHAESIPVVPGFLNAAVFDAMEAHARH